MGIVEGDVGWRDAIAFSLNVDVPGSDVADGKDVGLIVKNVALLSKILAAADGLAAHRHGVRNEIQTQHVRGFTIESRIGDRSPAIRDLRNGGE